MLSIAKRLCTYAPCLRSAAHQLRWARTEAGPPRRRPRSFALATRKAEEKSEWWIVDGEMHEIGDHVPPRERFVIPRDNIPNKRRKQLREQFMRRTRLVLKESVSLRCSVFKLYTRFPGTKINWFSYWMWNCICCNMIYFSFKSEGAWAVVQEIHGAISGAQRELGEVVLGWGLLQKNCPRSCKLWVWRRRSRFLSLQVC